MHLNSTAVDREVRPDIIIISIDEVVPTSGSLFDTPEQGVV